MRSAATLTVLGLSIAFACAHPAETSIERASRVHRDAIVLDTHADTTPRFQDPAYDFSARHYAKWALGDDYRDPILRLPGEVPADLLARLGEGENAGETSVTLPEVVPKADFPEPVLH